MNTPCCLWCIPVEVEGETEYVCQLQHRCGGEPTGRGEYAAMDLGEMAERVLWARALENPDCPLEEAVGLIVENFWRRHGPERKALVAALLGDLCRRWIDGRIVRHERGGEAGGFRYVFRD